MPATDLSADQIILNFSAAYIQQRYRSDRVTEANLYKLARAVSNGFLLETGQVIDQLEPQRFPLTAEQGFLDIPAIFWNTPRRVGEEDEALRLRIGQTKLVRWGAFNIDEMLTLLSTLIDVPIDEVGFVENVNEAGDFEPALIQFSLDPTVFSDAGIVDVAGAIVELETALEAVAPAGVRVFITTQGTAIWDDASTIWDESGTWNEGTSVVGTAAPSIARPSTGGMGEDSIGEDPIGEG